MCEKCDVTCECGMSYISVAEEEGGEPIELPTEEDGTGGRNCQSSKENGRPLNDCNLPEENCRNI